MASLDIQSGGIDISNSLNVDNNTLSVNTRGSLGTQEIILGNPTEDLEISQSKISEDLEVIVNKTDSSVDSTRSIIIYKEGSGALYKVIHNEPHRIFSDPIKENYYYFMANYKIEGDPISIIITIDGEDLDFMSKTNIDGSRVEIYSEMYLTGKEIYITYLKMA